MHGKIDSPQRRAFLISAAALLLCGCRPAAMPTASDLTTGAPPTPSAGAPSLVTSPVPGPPVRDPEPEPTVQAQEIEATFSGRRPSYWGLQAPNVLQTLPPAAGIALTLDFCGGPGGNGTDHAALTTLKRHGIPATLFLNARWIRHNMSLARELAAEPLFELANHGTRHAPLSVSGNSAYGIPGTENSREVYAEIMTNDNLLAEITGRRPRFFRPGTAYLDDIAAEICLALGAIPTGFSINADAGATYPASVVAAETTKARPGDIIISHGNHPGSGTAAGLAAALPALLDKGYTFTRLSVALP